MKKNYQRVYQRLGYTFHTPALFIQALTHRSAGVKTNERFEFLGDAVLNLVIAHALLQNFPEKSEGNLSPLRASLVRGETLTEIAQELELGDYLILGSGELRSGGVQRASILADALEAIFGAIYLEQGFVAAQTVILKLYASRLEDARHITHVQDSKTRLQEYLQALKKALPIYTLKKVEGTEHDQVFYVQCHAPSFPHITKGVGNSRKKAEQQAADALLQILSDTRK
ncbi:MAG: ribonuclease III [Legionellaceae bacterium]|nr:ribonuclease III [Legionellaceae bacterium]